MNLWSDIMKYLDFVNNNLYLYLAVITVLLIVDVAFAVFTVICVGLSKVYVVTPLLTLSE